MVQVGRRFELAGRAAVANRFELAAFEAGELGELFENDVPRASLPKEGPTTQIPAMAKAFLGLDTAGTHESRSIQGSCCVRGCIRARSRQMQ